MSSRNSWKWLVESGVVQRRGDRAVEEYRIGKGGPSDE